MKEKIGIWGFGTTGKAAVRYCSGTPPEAELEILDKRLFTELTEHEQQILTQYKSIYIPQTELTHFLERNTFIIPSPGIDLHPYSQYNHKWLTELGLFARAWHKPIIAVTGTVGKTSLVHLLSHVLAHYTIRVATGGNIGTSMLDLIAEQQEKDLALLELSSFQLEYTRNFAPTLALWTNFYPNHLDRHGSLENYFQAKYQLIAYQTAHQYTLLPFELCTQLYTAELQERPLAFFTEQPLASTDYKKLRPCDTLYVSDHTHITKYSRNCFTQLLQKNLLPSVSYSITWLMITAACDLLGLPLTPLTHLPPLTLPQHRLDTIATVNGVTFYNDSKATIAQATLAALSHLHRLSPQSPHSSSRVYLFLGGISKGVDRALFIKQLVGQVQAIVCFGTEAEQLYTHCMQAKIPASCYTTLEEAFWGCTQQLQVGDSVLFSPAGASYDLFKNYQERGNYFVQLVHQYQQLRQPTEQKTHVTR